jgi:hypothetical protein
MTMTRVKIIPTLRSDDTEEHRRECNYPEERQQQLLPSCGISGERRGLACLLHASVSPVPAATRDR